MIDKNLAYRAVQIAVEFDEKIANLYNISNEIVEEDIKKRLRACADLILGVLNRDVIMPMVSLYPDIDPDR